MTPTKTRLFIAALICFLVAILVYPFQSRIVPTWRLQIVDANGTPCPNMRVTQSWAHYSLYLDGEYSSENRLTDSTGTVEFPERFIRAGLARRLVVPVIAHILVIAHGGVGPDSSVWASGIKDVAWLSYAPGRPLPDKMRVEKCIAAAPNKSLDASGGSVFRIMIGPAMLD